MNINKLINEVKKKIGLVGHLSNVISDKGIRDIIYMSLDEFNRVSSFPVRIPLRPYLSSQTNFMIPVIDIDSSSKSVEVKIADDIVELCKESGVIIKEVRLHRDSYIPIVPQTRSLKQDMLYITEAQRRSTNTTKPRLRVRLPNTLIIENYTSNLTFYNSFLMELRVTHPKTLSTIDVGLEGWFEELCRRNIEMVLYNNNLRFLNIDMGSIRVELNIENFQSAESEKNNLLEKMRARSEADDLVFYA